MSKWADYLITTVRFNAGDIHIERVKVQKDLGDELGPAPEMSRAHVVKQIGQGKTCGRRTISATRKMGEPL